MIALYVRWDRAASAPPDRFSRSLAINSQNAVGVARIGSATVAAVLPPRLPARGWRPQRSPDGSIVLFSGHIDNSAELQASLGCGACSDGALYGACVARWGDDADGRIVGRYSSAILSEDAPSVRLARSPINAPPLHIWHDEGQLVVASTPRAIFATGVVESRLDEQKIADSLFLNYREEERSWFAGITRLPIGARAKVTPRGMAVDRYYDPSRLPRIRFPKDEDYVEMGTALFEEATRAALRGFSRPAVSLSGGLDSQAVAAHVLRMLPPDSRLNSYTGIPEPGWTAQDGRLGFGNERAHVEAFAAMHPRLAPHWIDAAGLALGHRLSELLLLLGGSPRNIGNLHWIHEIWSRAKADGCDVLLTGDFGNYGFSANGYHALSEWFRGGHWIRLTRELNAIRPKGRSLFRTFVTEVAKPALPTPLWQRLEKLRGRKLPDAFASWCPLNRDWARAMRVEERATEQGYDFHYRNAYGGQGWRRTVGGGELGDLDQAFEQLHGLPARDPTSYRPLLEFCWSIPVDQYLRNGESRWLARRMLRGLVPEQVRTESRYGVQSDDWPLRLRRQREELSSELGRLMADPRMAERLDLSGLKSALDGWSGDGFRSNDEFCRLYPALVRGVATARFIRFAEGRNDDQSCQELEDGAEGMLAP